MSYVPSPFEIFMSAATLILGMGALTLLLFGDNPLFEFTERFFISQVTAYTTFIVYGSLRSSAIDYMLRGQRLWLIIPVAIGALAFTRFTRFRWAARYPIAILSGIGAGLLFGVTIRGDVLNAISATVSDLTTTRLAKVGGIYSAVFSLLGVFTVMTYFLYSTKYSKFFHEKGQPLYYVTRVGRLYLVATFGYMVAGTASGQGGKLTEIVVNIVRRSVLTFLAALGYYPYG